MELILQKIYHNVCFISGITTIETYDRLIANTSSDKRQRMFHFIRSGFAIFLLSIAEYYIIAQYFSYFTNYGGIEMLSIVTSYCQHFASTVFFLLSACGFLGRCRHYFSFMEDIYRVQICLSHTDRQHLKIRYRYCIVLVLYFTAIGLEILLCYRVGNVPLWTSWVINSYENFLQVAFTVSLAEIILLLERSFHLINNKLLEYMHYSKQGLDPRNFRLNHYYDMEFAHLTGTPYLPIYQLRSFHWTLCEASETMNPCYGGQILTIMFSVFVKATTLLYGMNSDLFGKEKPYKTGYIGWVYLADNLVRMALEFLKVYFLVSASASVSNEAKNTALIVSRLLNRKLKPDMKQLEVFAVQLLHTEVNITACGIFTLNHSVLTGMIGAITTYLIILIQFKNSDKVNTVVGEE